MELEYRNKKIQTLPDVSLEGKMVFCRVDFNVPIRDGIVQDDTRIVEALPTIQFLLKEGARVTLASHLGRPKGHPRLEFSLIPVGEWLARLLDREVIVPESCIGEGARHVLGNQRSDTVVLLENLRFHPGEEANDQEFALELRNGFELYVSDAFGALHRKHASVYELPRTFETRVAGKLVEKELNALTPLLGDPPRPYSVVLGGAKVSDKIKVLEALLRKVDQLYLGGAMVFTFLRALGYATGRSLVEEDRILHAKRILEEAKSRNVEVFFPKDFRLGRSVTEPGESRLSAGVEIPDDWMGLDVGPETVTYFASKLKEVQTIFWNGPLGLFEIPPFDNGTLAFAEALSRFKSTRIVGGGDSAAAVARAGVANRFTHISTGGGATLEFLQGKGLPGLDALAV